MMGRATRLCPKIKKTHFEIYDPVRVYDSLQDVNTMKPVVANPAVTFTQLLSQLEETEDEKQIEYQISQIIAKLQRKRRNIDSATMEQFINLTDGKDPAGLIASLGKNAGSKDIPIETEKRDTKSRKQRLMAYEKALQYLDQAKKPKTIVVSTEEDELISHERGYGKASRPEDYLDAFAAYIKNNMNEIAALNVVCTRPKDLTRDSLKSLRLTLDREGFTTQQLNTAVSQMTNEEMAADIITLIRRYAIGSSLISHEARIRKAVDRLKKQHKFSRQEINWIDRLEKYLIEESVLNVSVFDEDSRFKAQGGFSRIDKVFHNQLESIVLELNEYLYDDGGRTA